MNIKCGWVLLLAFLFVATCGGTLAMPIKVEREGDASKSCKRLDWDLEELEKDMDEMIKVNDVSHSNDLTKYLAGGMLAVDNGRIFRKEIKSYKMRYNHLLSLGNKKGCKINKQALPEEPIKPPSEDYEGDEF
jgi:hypothetical protein